MGMLFGGYLSQRNDVWLIDVNKDRITKINSDGVAVRETDVDMIFYPRAAEESESLGKMDLILVFVKAMYTCSALEANRCLIGPDTYLMSLQNGVGHEVKLLRFSDRDHVIIGSTQHNSSIIDNQQNPLLQVAVTQRRRKEELKLPHLMKPRTRAAECCILQSPATQTRCWLPK